MKLLTHDEISAICYEGVCCDCGEELLEHFPEAIYASKKLIYVKCNNCYSAFKFSTKEMRHSMDLKIYEITEDIDRTNYAVKGYSISNETFEKNRNRFPKRIMKLLKRDELRSITDKQVCCDCGEELLGYNYEIIKGYSPNFKCNNCYSVFKIVRKEIRHPMDRQINELTFIDGETYYAVKGYSIGIEIFEDKFYKFHKKVYPDSFFSEDEFLIT